MRVAIANIVRPRQRIEPEALLRRWPTLGNVASAVQRAGAQVTVLQSFHRDAELALESVRFQFIAERAFPGQAAGLMPGRLARAARAVRPDIIHVNGLDFAWHTRVLCGLGVPVLARDHASSAEVRCRRRRWGLAKVRGVAFTDRAQADPLLRRGCLPPDVGIYEVPESSTAFTPGSVEAARAETGLYGNPAVLWVGRLDDNKDPLTILDAVEQASLRLPDLQLWCCFQKHPLLPKVRARLERSPELASRVHLLGEVPHARIELLCRAADFFMLGSHRESCGYALMEALACGTTPIVSDIASFRSLTAGARIGALVPPENAAGFADELVRLASEPRADLRRRAVEHFKASLSMDALGRRLCEIYATLRQASE